MTPFDANLDNDAGHAIDQDDLIAFHLHELSSPQERAVRRVLRSNPALQSESLAIASTLRAFPKHEAPLPLDTAALDRHWQALRNSLPVHVAAAVSPRSLFTRWAIPTLAASALAATAIFLALRYHPDAPPAITANTTPPSAAAMNSSPSLPSEAVQLANAIHPVRSISPRLVDHLPFLDQLPSEAAASSPARLPATQPTPNQPTPSQPATAAAPTASSVSTNLATSQQPTSLTPTAPPAPTALNQTRPTARPHYDRTTDITLAAFGNFTPNRSSTSTAGTGDSAVTASYTQSTTSAVGALASFHQQFRPWLGYRVTAAHSEPTFEYTYQAPYEGQPSSLGTVVYEHVYEFSGAYVVQGPHHRRLSTSAEAGAGVLAFRPPSSSPSSPLVGNSVRPTGVLGIAAEYALTRHLALTAAYRLLLYKAPSAYSTFGSTVPPAPNNLTLSNEPVIGLTYRFHPPRAE